MKKTVSGLIPIPPPKDSYRLGTFDAIPTSILRIIQQYLTNYDYCQLLNTNKAIFQSSKYETIYYTMKSLNYNTKNEYKQQAKAFQRLISSIQDKSRQISLHAIYYHSYFIDYYRLLLPGIHKLVFQCNGDFWMIHSPSEYSSLLSNIYHIELLDVIPLKSLVGLRGMTILEIKRSASLLSIDYIPGLKRLVLQDLPKLQDISQYGNIPELFISNCCNLSFEGLGNHQKVLIKPCNNQRINDISLFKDVIRLEYEKVEEGTIGRSIRNLPIFSNVISLVFNNNKESFNPLFFPNLSFLKLTSAFIHSETVFPSALQSVEFVDCNFNNLSIVKNVKKLKFVSCNGEGFSNVTILSNARILIFHDIKELYNVKGLEEVYELRIESCLNIVDISKLGSIHRLCLDRCSVKDLNGLGQGNSEVRISLITEKIDLSPLRSVYKVILKDCSHLEHGRDLAGVHHLSLIRCDRFKDTSDIGRLKSLRLIECYAIQTLVGLENIPEIHLISCHKLENIDCLGKQDSLIIFNCRKLQKIIEVNKTRMFEDIFHRIPFLRINIAQYNLEVFSTKSILPTMFDEHIDN